MKDIISEIVSFAHEDETATGHAMRVSVTAIRTSKLLGRIDWYVPWRQYVFRPLSRSVFNRRCLEDINAQLKEMMIVWKETQS